jgi:hypothetical protein
MIKGKARGNKNSLIFLSFLYLIISIAITYPLIAHFSKGVLGPPMLEDHRIYLWEISQFAKSIFHDFKNPFIVEDIFYPRGLHYQDMNFTLAAIFVAPISFVLHNPTIAFNLWVIIGYTLSGIFTYLLAFHLTNNKYASFLASLIFTFSAYHYQVVFNGQLEFSGIFWLPLLLYCLILFLEEISVKRAVYLALVFSMTALSSGYYGAFSILMIVFFSFLFFFFDNYGFSNWKQKGIIKILFSAIPAVIIILIILLPFYQALYNSDRIITEGGYDHFRNSFKFETNGGVADIIDYITPLPFYYKDFGFGYIKWDSRPANCYYISFLLLPSLLIFMWRKNKQAIEKIILAIFLIFFILSMGSSLRYNHELVKPFGLSYVPLPGSILHLIPVISDARTIARLGVFTSLFASILIGLAFLPVFSDKIAKSIKLLVLAALSVFFFLETYSFVIPSTIKASVAPSIYKIIAETQGDFSIVEYPLRICAGYPFNEEELFYQTLHGKKTVFGFSPFRSKSLEAHLDKFGAFSQNSDNFKIDKNYLTNAKVKYFLVNKGKINGMFPDSKEEVYRRITAEIKSIPKVTFENNLDEIELYKLGD